MTTATVDAGRSGPVALGRADVAQRRWIWLGLGAGLAMLAVGGRWDLPLAAWLFPVLLLRFSRLSRPLQGLGLVWAVSIGQAVWWAWQLAVPLNPTAVVGCVAFGTMFSLPYVLDRLLERRLGLWGGLLLFPAALAACEFVMGVFSPLGTAYGLLAVTQYADLPLLQVISITGPYGVAFLIGWFATAANLAWEQPALAGGTRTAVGVYAVVLAAVFVGGEARLAFFPQSSAGAARVAGITPSLALFDAGQRALGGRISDQAASRLDPASLGPAFAAIDDELLAGTRRAAQGGAQLVIWSEDGAELLAADAPDFLAHAAALAREEHIWLEIADKVFLPSAPYGRDETHLIAPDGRTVWTYQKAHPIPGLETYAPGDRRVPVATTPFGRLANVICYDADFPAMMRADADIMLVPGGDWPEIGRVHTLRMASLRAIEQGHALFRQAFNGVSAAFDDQGHVLAVQDTTGPGPHIMVADVPVRGAMTVYRLIGDVFAWLCAVGVAGLVGLALVRPRRALS